MNENISYNEMSYYEVNRLVINKIESEIKELQNKICNKSLAEVILEDKHSVNSEQNTEEILNKITFGIQLAKHTAFLVKRKEDLVDFLEMDNILETIYYKYLFSMHSNDTTNTFLKGLKNAVSKVDLTSHF